MSAQMTIAPHADAAWLATLNDIMLNGLHSEPRGMLTKEILHRTMSIHMTTPVVRCKARSLNYRFMAAEAYWILSGDDRVATIAPYNKRIADFSDDGERFFGAYGPKVVDQVPYVVNTLVKDRFSRQAGLTIWREKPGPTKDVPCTVAMFFTLRDGVLSCHVTMRSSDAWLGVPYDLFNFSMVGHMVCALLNERGVAARPGVLYLTAFNQHLYARDFEAIEQVRIANEQFNHVVGTPEHLWRDYEGLLSHLKELRDAPVSSDLRWWNPKD